MIDAHASEVLEANVCARRTGKAEARLGKVASYVRSGTCAREPSPPIRPTACTRNSWGSGALATITIHVVGTSGCHAQESDEYPMLYHI